jgi:hypothetical protein
MIGKKEMTKEEKEVIFGKPMMRDLTKREWFAGMALQGMLANASINVTNVYEEKISEWSFRQADAMLKEGAK